MPEAIYVRPADQIRVTLENAAGAGELRQLADGRAGYYDNPTGASSGDKILFTSDGQVTLAKTNGVVILDGAPVFWDYSANSITYQAVNDRDFPAGTACGDYASGDTQIVVNLNVKPSYLVDLARDAFISAL